MYYNNKMRIVYEDSDTCFGCGVTFKEAKIKKTKCDSCGSIHGKHTWLWGGVTGGS